MNGVGALIGFMWLLFLFAIFIGIAVLFVGSFFRARHGESKNPQEGWSRTEEVFKDPSTGRIMRVWLEPETGMRHYIPEIPEP